MGWSYGLGDTRKDVIRSIVRSFGSDKHEVIRHCTRGNVLWTVEDYHPAGYHDRSEPIHEFIGCYLLDRGTGDGWGYKSMDESMHPYYYTCPLSYLDDVPVASEEWRAEVRKYHARARERRESRRRPKPQGVHSSYG